MERFVDIETKGNVTTAIFLTDDISEVNMLRRAIKSEILTYAIDIVIFHENNSPRHDEILALRLGQLVIDNDVYQPTDERIRIEVSGPKEFTTQDIPNIPFKYVTPIAQLSEGQKIVCDVIVREGSGRIHAKWSPVSLFSIIQHKSGYHIKFKNVGMLSSQKIISKGLEMMKTAASRPPSNIFTRPLVPAGMSL